MKYFIEIMLFLSINFTIINLFNIKRQRRYYQEIKEKINSRNTKYINKLVYQKENKTLFKYNEKNLFDKLYILLIKTGIMENKYLWWIIPQTIIIFCFIIFVISYLIFYPILKLKSLAITLCIPIAFIPIFLLIIYSEINEEKIEKNLISYIIQLKNQVKINNDIIFAFKNTSKYAMKPLNTYINIFLFEISNGVNITVAFENLKNKVNIERFKQLITNLESCYMNGGDFYNLLDKTQNIFLKVQEERNNRNNQTMSSRIVLIILIAMSIFVYFNFINSNQENYNIMINDFIGSIILHWNFVSIWIMMFLITLIKKIDKEG